MKKTIFFLFVSVLFINLSLAQTTNTAKASEKKRWPSSDRMEFITECIVSAKEGMSEDSARQYCYCMQEKVEAKYPTVEEAAHLSEDDLQLPEWQTIITNCLMNSGWGTSDRKEFMRECITSAKKSLEESKAKSYCECMLFKVEQVYPKPADASQLTTEKLNSPEWKKKIQACFDF